ncbi:cytochrome P450 704C1-like protein [Tanacetum coccineum]
MNIIISHIRVVDRICSDEDLWELITKGYLGNLLGTGYLAADGDVWRHQRKLASYEFSTKVLRDFSADVFRSNTAKLVKKLTGAAVHKQIINLQDLLMKSTLDSIFKVGFGFDLDTLSGSDEVSNQFMTAFDDSNGITYWRYVDLLWRVKRYFNVGSEAILKKNLNVVDSFVFELIEQKREQMKNGKANRNKDDILSRFLIESEKDPENLNDKYLRDISLSFIIAGKDTSASTLTWFFYMLCKHNLIQEKVALEVKQAIGTQYTYSIDEFSHKLTEMALDKMHYLHAALTETLRLYPAVPLIGVLGSNSVMGKGKAMVMLGKGKGYSYCIKENIMAEGDIDNLTMEKYRAFTQGNQASGVVKPEIGGNVNFEIKSQFMRELREDTFFRNKNDDAHEHVKRVLDIISLFDIPGVTHDAVMLRVFPITLTGAAKRWVDRLSPGTVDSWDLLKKPLSKAAIQTMHDHSQKWHDGSSSRNIDSRSNTEGIASIVSKLDSLGRDMKKLKENVHAIQVGCQLCGGTHLDKGSKYRVGPPGYYTCVDNRAPFEEKRPSLEELMSKHLEESTRRRAEMEEWTQIEQLTKEFHAKVASEVPNSSVGQCKAVYANDEAPIDGTSSNGTNELYGVTFISNADKQVARE